MKTKWMTGVAIVALGATLAIAAPHGRAERRGALASKLNLTEAQQAQIAEIRKSARGSNAGLFEEHARTLRQLRAAKEEGDTAKAEQLRATLDAQRAHLMQVRQSEKQRIAAVLTPEQRQQLEALGKRGPRGHRFGERGGKHGQRAARARAWEKLNLTEEQKTRIAQIRRSSREQNQPLFEEARATRREMAAAREAGDATKLGVLKEAAAAQRKQLNEVRKATRERVLAVLTAEQRSELETLESRRGRHGGRGR